MSSISTSLVSYCTFSIEYKVYFIHRCVPDGLNFFADILTEIFRQVPEYKTTMDWICCASIVLYYQYLFASSTDIKCGVVKHDTPYVVSFGLHLGNIVSTMQVSEQSSPESSL